MRGRGGAACRRHRLRGPACQEHGPQQAAGGRRRQRARGRGQCCCARSQQACRKASATAGSPRSFLGRVRRCSAPAAAAERRASGIAAALSAAGSLIAGGLEQCAGRAAPTTGRSGRPEGITLGGQGITTRPRLPLRGRALWKHRPRRLGAGSRERVWGKTQRTGHRIHPWAGPIHGLSRPSKGSLRSGYR